MAEGIQYKRELFDFVNNLTAINQSIAFERVGDNIVIRKADKNRTIPYILSVPSEYFDITETVAFYKYDNFYRFLNSYKNPTLNIDNGKMIISENKSKSRYTLSDPEGIINGPKRVNFEQGDIRFTLTKEQLDDISKHVGLIKANRAKIEVVDNNIKFLFYSTETDNDYEAGFECERLGDFDDDFSFLIFANRFSYLPVKHDYVFDITAKHYDEDGNHIEGTGNFMRISLVHEEIECNFYSGELK